jgi:flagellar basal-body rod protein FlgF
LDNAIYVALSRQMTLRRELDVTANNIANVDTAGFKVESLMVKTDPQVSADPLDPSGPLKYVLDDGVARDFGQGALHQTDRPLDLGIEGEGFFKVMTPQGERYTRDGRFTITPDGRLATASGALLQGDGGDITIDPTKGEVKIAADGTISQGALRVGKLAVVDFAAKGDIEKDGDNLYRNTTNVPPATASAALVHQGMLESSNVNSVLQVTRLIEISRAYESISKMMEQTAELDRASVQRLGRVA